MGFLFGFVTRLLHGIMELVGLARQSIEIEPGTIMNIWIPKETIIKVDGKPQYVPPKKPVVLFIHCFAMDGIFVWFAQVLFLTRKYSVYVPDLLFFGGSTTDKTERSTSLQAEFLAKGMGILKVNKVNLVGLSYGGMVGFKMAKLYPELVHSMVVTAAVVELTESISQRSLKQIGISTWQDLLLPETMEGFKRMLKVGAHKLPWIPSFIYNGIFETMFTNRKQRSELLEALVVLDNNANAQTPYSQRIHMLVGEEDRIFNLEIVNAMKRYLGDKTTVGHIKDAGHLVPLEKPFAYNRHLKLFLASQN